MRRITMLMWLGLLAAFVASGRAEPPATAPAQRVLAKVLYGIDQAVQGEEPVEDWIAQAVTSQGARFAGASTGWIELSEQNRDLYASEMGGRLIKGWASRKAGQFEVHISGVKIKPPIQPVVLKSGDQTLLKLTSYPGSGNTYLALMVGVSPAATQPAPATQPVSGR